MKGSERAAMLGVCVLVAVGTGVGIAAADGTFSSSTPDASFNPVVLTTTVPTSLHVGTKIPVRIAVQAAPGLLDPRSSATGITGHQSELKLEVKLATECGGQFAYTSGITLMNRPLVPQPTAGRAYSGGAVNTGAAAPKATGTYAVCVWLVDEETPYQRIFASDQSQSVYVAKALPKPKPKAKATAKTTSKPTKKTTQGKTT